jgi:protein TonB
MFQSVIAEQEGRSRRLGTSMGVSTLVHAGLFAGILALSAQQADKKDLGPEVVFYRAAPAQPPRGSPAPATPSAPRPKPRPKKAFTQPRLVPPPVPDKPDQPESPPETPETPEPVEGVTGGHPEGVLTNGVIGALPIFGMNPEPGGTGEDVLPFGEGMTPPKLLSGGQLQYTREALEARVQGTMVVKCIITREGTVEDCRTIKGLPHMERAVRESLATRRYQPVTFQGRPVNVSYVFTVRLQMP